MLGLPLELIAILGILGVVVLFRYRAKVFSGTPSINLGGANADIKKYAMPLLLGGAALLAIFFWDDITKLATEQSGNESNKSFLTIVKSNVFLIGLLLFIAGRVISKKIVWIAGLVIIVLFSGPGLLTMSGIKTVDSVTTCWADSAQQKCLEWKIEQAAEERERFAEQLEENKRQAALIEAARPAPEPVIVLPAETPSQVRVPACGSGNWVEVDIPGKWNVTPSWNYAAANYEVMQNGEWVTRNQKKPGMINMAVRFCTPQPRNVGKQMYLTWTSKP